jgi:hypothetical protein
MHVLKGSSAIMFTFVFFPLAFALRKFGDWNVQAAMR